MWVWLVTVAKSFKQHVILYFIATAKKIVLFHMRNDPRFQLTQDLPDMGESLLLQ